MPLAHQQPNVAYATKMTTPPSSVPSTRTALLFMLAGLAFPAVAGAQPFETMPGTELATVDPADVPGRAEGPRTREDANKKEPAVPAPKPEDRDWFGGKSYWQWSHMTGDWAGHRTALEDAGLTINISWSMDWSGIWGGGVTRRASTRHLWDINARFDLEKMAGLKGTTVYADVQLTDSRSQSLFVGDVQGSSVLETNRNIRQLSELWWEQVWADGVLRTKLGKIDAATEFAFVKAADMFTHTGALNPQTMLLQPTYPDASTGALAFLYPCENFYLGAGVFDGSQSAGVQTGGQGPKSAFHGDETYYAAEGGITWTGKECELLKQMGSGRLACGYWYHTGAMVRFDGTPTSHAEGGYAIFEQQLFKRDAKAESCDKGLFAFVQGGITGSGTSSIDRSIAAGLTLRGTCDGRPDDTCGFVWSCAHLSRAAGSVFTGNETAYEVFYNAQITPALGVRPYLQVIDRPSASAIGQTVIGGLRVQLNF